MKPIVEKILKSGIVDRHVATLMEKWGTLEPGASTLVGEEDLREASIEALTGFAEEIEGMIEDERARFLEVRLSVEVGEPLLAFVDKKAIVVFRDEIGNFIFPASVDIREGDTFSLRSGGVYEVDEVAPLYGGETRHALQVSASYVSRAG